MERAYIDQHDGGYWIKGTRVSLDSIVYAFNNGAAPESIQRSFSSLTLEEVYGAITFYLSHQQEIDAYLAESEAQFKQQAKELNAEARSANPGLFTRLAKAREQQHTTPK